MSEHTPGPWRANGSLIEGPAMALRIASVDWPKATPGTASRSPEESRANARLIAASPDLLKAAKRAIAVLKAQGESVRPGSVLGALDAAIKMAEGRHV